MNFKGKAGFEKERDVLFEHAPCLLQPPKQYLGPPDLREHRDGQFRERHFGWPIA
jgi:hypothetical protein